MTTDVEYNELVRDAELWRKHKDSFKVLEAMLHAASPLVLNRLKSQDAVNDAEENT